MTKLLIALTSAMLLASAANAQQFCAPYADVVPLAAENYNEHPEFEFEIVGQNSRVVGFVSADRSTATLFIVQDRGGVEVACVAATGENFRKPLAAKKPGRGA